MAVCEGVNVKKYIVLKGRSRRARLRVDYHHLSAYRNI